ncbi:MAG TPA: hypothetical protein VM582_08505, partial [Candidatus Thermoplasmatota archaeon]|nr:hypothetical protein [Candidatus Thermoplasmatota archaeon]
DSMRAELLDAQASLPPAVRDAASVLLTGAAESARLQREAYARLTPEERAFLLSETKGLDALYAAPELSEADLERLAHATQLAARVDGDKLAQAAVAATLATAEAKRILDGRDAFATQSAVTHVATGLRGILGKLWPFGAARAQDSDSCIRTTEGPPSNRDSFRTVETCPADDVLLRVYYPTFLTGEMTPAEFNAWRHMQSDMRTGMTARLPVNNIAVPGFGISYTCDERECVVYGVRTNDRSAGGEVNRELLVITGSQGTTHRPEMADRFVCASGLMTVSNGGLTGSNTFTTYTPVFSSCRFERVARYGAPTIHLDLGGDDTYQKPVGMVHINATIPVSLFLDMGGNDRYTDPSPLYDGASPIIRDLGLRAGHPTQGSATYGGVAVMVDASGADWYDAPTRSQGFARIGFALLADLGAETDIYRARDISQGASSETFSLGSAILFDRAGDDEYSTGTGQAFGLGAVLLDMGGRDIYRNEMTGMGIPIVHLNVVPGGDIMSFKERANNRVWIDGPASINLGIGIDQELVLTTGDEDRDGWNDAIEFLAGTDPRDPLDNPRSNPSARAGALVSDADGDGYPDYIERAFSTDENDRASYPAGFPSNVAVVVPEAVAGALPPDVRQFLGMGDDSRVAPFDDVDETTRGNFTGGDKIIDLRLPLQRAGTIDYGCTGEFYPNMSGPLGFNSSGNVFTVLGPGFVPESSQNGGPRRHDDGSVRQHCVYVSYATSEPGQGNATVPNNSTIANGFTFQMPAGILAVGDVVPTNYTVDYFVVIDLGGADTFENKAGGALLVRTQPTIPPTQTGSPRPDQQAVNNTFLAPSLVVNVDPRERTDGMLDAGASSADRYVNASQDFAHGSYFGVLVDTGGNDVYVARDASQGALGGVLLDLDGTDAYTARDLSQGAGLASQSAGSKPHPQTGQQARPVDDLPGGGNLPMDGQGSQRVGAHRRAIPALLLDLGANAGTQTFEARSHAQGFARGYATETPGAAVSPASYGILASLGEGKDVYTTLDGGRFTQGVGGPDSAGILFDRKGADSYVAKSFVSQGATISQSLYTNDPTRDGEPHPGYGILADLGGNDDYRWTDSLSKRGGVRSNERANNLTIERSATTTSSSGNGPRYMGDFGIHLDAEVGETNPAAALDGLMGAGQGRQAVGDTGNGFHVYMPTARLAIGTNASTTYDREFAFVVDLGGANRYNHSAGGLIRDFIADVSPGTGGVDELAPVATGTYGGGVNLFPVTIVVDAGRGDSTYNTRNAFAQGAGFFGVGVVADFGGRDTLTTLPRHAVNGSSTWMATPPVIDANIGADWASVPAREIEMRALNDSRFTTPWTMRIANDERSIYIALEGTTSSADEKDRLRDSLNISFDMGRRHTAWDESAQRTGIDQVRVYYDQFNLCTREDWGFQNFSTERRFARDAVARSGNLEVACRFTEDGKVFYEIKKDLVVGVPYDWADLGYCYRENVGFGYATNRSGVDCVTGVNEIGIMLRFGDFGAGFYDDPSADARFFTWPPGAVDADGHAGHLRTKSLSDEMRHWAAVGLAQLEADGHTPTATLPATLTQGVGVAGVGIVAMLGGNTSATQMFAGDQSLGFGAFGGLGVLIDTAGSDLYVGGNKTMGAGESSGLGLFIDLEGNDNYRPAGRALGWSDDPTTMLPGATGIGIFLDLAGDDHYAWRPDPAVVSVLDGAPSARSEFEGARGGLSEDGDSRPRQPGNNVFWAQNGSAAADFHLVSRIRELIVPATLSQLRGQARTFFELTEYDPNAISPWGNGCTDRAIPPAPGSGTPADFRVAGKVCFVAKVETGNGDLARNLRPRWETANATLRDSGAVERLLNEYLFHGTVGGTIDVESVDFLVDRARVATSFARVNVASNVTKWAAQVDLSDFEDGVARARALPVFSASLEQGFGTYLFQEVDNGNANNESNAFPSTRTILIDNPPRPKLSLAPVYTGIANATYSPYAVGAQQQLVVNFSVNHDVGEDGYAQHNDWRAPPASSNIPCDGVPTLPAPTAQEVRLCNLLPFYLLGDGRQLGTSPAPGSSPTIHPEFFDGSPYDGKTALLQTPMRIYTNQSFHLTLPERESLVPVWAYTTQVRIHLERADNVEVRDAAGKRWHLAFENATAPPKSARPSQLNELFPVLQTVFDILEPREGEDNNPVNATTQEVYLTICGDGKNAAKWNSAECRHVTGRPGTGQLVPCEPKSGNQPNLPADLLRTAATEADKASMTAANRKLVCNPYYND